MEQLARILMVVLLVGIVALCGGLWLLHTAFNDGNVWKGLVAVGLSLGAGFIVIMIGGGLAAR